MIEQVFVEDLSYSKIGWPKRHDTRWSGLIALILQVIFFIYFLISST